WQWAVIPSEALLGLEAPQALGPDGQPIQGQVIVQFQPNQAERDHLLADRVHQPYPAADVDESAAVMTVRDWQDGPRTILARERWRFAREETDRLVADDTRVWLEGGFEPGRVYEVTYRTRVCPVVGAGMRAGRGDCSLIHTVAVGEAEGPAGQRDVDPPAEERIYHFAGTQHGAGALPFASANPNDGAMGVHSFNVVDYSPLLRGALENLVRWVVEGVEPPPSAFPRLADRSAVPMAEALRPFAAIPGA